MTAAFVHIAAGEAATVEVNVEPGGALRLEVFNRNGERRASNSEDPAQLQFYPFPVAAGISGSPQIPVNAGIQAGEGLRVISGGAAPSAAAVTAGPGGTSCSPVSGSRRRRRLSAADSHTAENDIEQQAEPVRISAKLKDFLRQIRNLEHAADGWTRKPDAGPTGWAVEFGISERAVRKRRRALVDAGLIITKRRKRWCAMRATAAGRAVDDEYRAQRQSFKKFRSENAKSSALGSADRPKSSGSGSAALKVPDRPIKTPCTKRAGAQRHIKSSGLTGTEAGESSALNSWEQSPLNVGFIRAKVPWSVIRERARKEYMRGFYEKFIAPLVASSDGCEFYLKAPCEKHAKHVRARYLYELCRLGQEGSSNARESVSDSEGGQPGAANREPR